MFLISRRIALILCLASLVGCSLAPLVASESEDYNDTVEAVTNSLLVTNILRARDEVPLYFTDLSQIRGQIMLNYSAQAAFPIGPSNRSGTGVGVRSLGTIGITQQNLPFFDVAPLNNKQFYQGIIEPLTEGVFAFYLNSGIPPEVLFYLLVSGIETVKVNGDKLSYQPVCGWLEPCFNKFVKTWTRDDMPPRAVVTNQPMEIGPKVAADAKALVAAASAGLTAKADGKLVQFSKKVRRRPSASQMPAAQSMLQWEYQTPACSRRRPYQYHDRMMNVQLSHTKTHKPVRHRQEKRRPLSGSYCACALCKRYLDILDSLWRIKIRSNKNMRRIANVLGRRFIFTFRSSRPQTFVLPPNTRAKRTM
jgi:hypothetical protein